MGSPVVGIDQDAKSWWKIDAVQGLDRWIVLDTSETGYILQVNVLSRRGDPPPVLCLVLSMPCLPGLRATIGPFQSCDGNKHQAMHARSAMQTITQSLRYYS
ncbi:hypothetical protein FJTKL_10741 [Diaporthe vaccinii]|uniref:F5/8 type C domain-containing protein n=1 Tax=Diaporthe vaccinii TaxID=105482 RepID=A0ABR4FBK6_9PEZI